MKLRWRFGIIAGIFLAVFSLYPQMKLVYMRGSEWNGHYAYNDIDEVAYASYLQALIDGRPRKNDPYTGHDDTPGDPQPESLFSIQFAAPYSIAIPARIIGMGAPWAMTISGALAAFLTALAIFWIIGSITGDDWFAMAGSVIVLAGGALFAGEGAISEILFDGFSYPYFPGFRRYIPAMAFPAFFAFVGLVWKIVGRMSLASGDNKGAIGGEPLSPTPVLLISLASTAFGYTVFSYFYVWTTAVAWLGCLGICLLVARPYGVWRDVRSLMALGISFAIFLGPYAYLLSMRSHTMDDVQLLVNTHAPDLGRMPAVISYFTLAAVAIGVAFRVFSLRERAVLFAVSLALAVIVVFNQQVITGRSLQPIHYQVFIGNYVAGLAIVIVAGIYWNALRLSERPAGKVVAAALTAIAVVWGTVECHYTVRVLDDVNVARDEQVPVARRLAELGTGDAEVHSRVVLHLSIAEGDDLPTIAPQAVLWSRHQHVFAGLTWQENKERYYQYLYYQGVTPRQLADSIKRGDFVSMIALFGWGRHTDRLNSDFKPLTNGEVDAEAARYAQYIATFDPNIAGPKLDYLITPTGADPDLENIDKWYVRSDSEQYGAFTLYRLQKK